MKICVVGLGYVGAVTSVCLARNGHQVLGVDTDETKVELMRSGNSPVVEEGIEELTRSVVKGGQLTTESYLPDEVASYDAVFVCVGTPSASNGSQDLTAIHRVTAQLGEILRHAEGYPVITYRSTLAPGTMKSSVWSALESHSGGQIGQRFGLAFQPEFLREGTSIQDFYNPPMTIVGADSPRTGAVLRNLFKELPGEFIETDIGAAELLKLTCNAFHALKVSFANEVGRFARDLEVDPRDVMEIFCKDTQLNISPYYLRPGFAFGGSCLPKDLRSISHIARQRDVELPMLGNILASNEIHIDHTAQLVMNCGPRNIGFIGLSFKEGTDDLRESPLVALAERLIGKGYELMVYDPFVRYAQLMGSNLRFIESSIPHIGNLITDDIDAVLQHADVLIIGHNSTGLLDKVRAHLDRGGYVVDLVGLDDSISKRENYEGVCW